MKTVAWARNTAFPTDTVNGVGRRETMPNSYFPEASQRYAYACRGGGMDEHVVDQGLLRNVYSTGLEHSPSSTQVCFDALLGAEALNGEAVGVENMRAWVSAAAPPLVYDAARARHEQQPRLDLRDELAARWRAKAEERALERPPPPMSRRQMRQITMATLSNADQTADRQLAQLEARRAALDRRDAEEVARAAVESRKLKKK